MILVYSKVTDNLKKNYLKFESICANFNTCMYIYKCANILRACIYFQIRFAPHNASQY